MSVLAFRPSRISSLLPLIQIRTSYGGRKKCVTVWRKSDGLQMRVDIRDAGKAKYSRTPPGVTPVEKPTKKKGKDKDPPEVRLSKTISWLLRHGAKGEGLVMRPDGFARVQDLLDNPRFKDLNFMTLESMVKKDEKQRFALQCEPDPNASVPSPPIWWIRANQGHSMSSVQVEMTQLTSAREIPMAVHGTTAEAWKSIAKDGLSKMKRNHIHLAQGIAGSNVISGMRKSSEILIFIDVEKALAAGIKFYISANGVVLTEGDERGYLSPACFERVENADRVPLPGWDGATARTTTASAVDRQAEATMSETLAKELEMMEIKT